MLLEIQNGTVSRGGTAILTQFDFYIRGTEKIAIVGRNGAGKTSLLELLAGLRDLDRDEKHPSSGIFRARTISTGLLTQRAVPKQLQGLSVEDYITDILLRDRPAEYLFSRERFHEEQKFNRIFTELGFSMDDKLKKLGEFSGGEQTKIMLIRFFLEEPDILLLDEPTNHLDIRTCEWLEENLRNYGRAVVAVSHDRYFIDRFADTVWEMEGGKLTRYAGNYTVYRRQKLAHTRKLLKEYEAQEAEIARLNALIKKFRNKPRKAAFARSRKKILDRMRRIERPDPDAAHLQTDRIEPARPGSRIVLSCEHLKFGYDSPLKEISFRVRRGQKIGIFGPNGTGKSAFLKTVAGLLPPVSGKLQIGETIDAAYFDQMSAAIYSDKSVFDWFHDRYPALTGGEIRTRLAAYLFRGTDLGKKVSVLSGGEKARLVLAAILESRPNLLLLDEPTNNMDIPTKETLEQIFRNYQGTLLFISHDRYFLSHAAESLLCFAPGNPEVLYYPFGYAHYAERRRAEASGTSGGLLQSAENQRLIDGLKSVPKAEHFYTRGISEEEAYADWQFDLNRTPREEAENAFRRCSEDAARYPATEAEYADWDTYLAEKSRQLEAACREWTAQCLAWYDIWLITQPYD